MSLALSLLFLPSVAMSVTVLNSSECYSRIVRACEGPFFETQHTWFLWAALLVISSPTVCEKFLPSVTMSVNVLLPGQSYFLLLRLLSTFCGVLNPEHLPTPEI